MCDCSCVSVCVCLFALVCVFLCKGGQVDGVSFLAAGSVLVCVTYELSRKQCSLTKLWCTAEVEKGNPYWQLMSSDC